MRTLWVFLSCIWWWLWATPWPQDKPHAQYQKTRPQCSPERQQDPHCCACWWRKERSSTDWRWRRDQDACRIYGYRCTWEVLLFLAPSLPTKYICCASAVLSSARLQKWSRWWPRTWLERSLPQRHPKPILTHAQCTCDLGSNADARNEGDGLCFSEVGFVQFCVEPGRRGAEAVAAGFG